MKLKKFFAGIVAAAMMLTVGVTVVLAPVRSLILRLPLMQVKLG